MARHIVAHFPDARSADKAAADLRAAGFDESRIRIFKHGKPESGGAGAEDALSKFADWLRTELAHLGIGREEAGRHHEHVAHGGVLLTVDARGRDEEAQRVLDAAGADRLSQRAGSARASDDQPGVGSAAEPPGVDNEVLVRAHPGPDDDTRALGGGQIAEAPDGTFPDDDIRLRQREADESNPLRHQGLSGADRNALEDQDIRSLP